LRRLGHGGLLSLDVRRRPRYARRVVAHPQWAKRLLCER
jgi:hypothetical protein